MSKRKITNIKELLIEFEKYGTAKEVIEELSEKYLNDINIKNDINYSKQGFLYERIWDICIKFGLVKNIINFDNSINPLLHFRGNVNNDIIIKDSCKEFKSFFDDYLEKKNNKW